MSWQEPGRLKRVTLSHETGPERNYVREHDADGREVWYPVSEPGRKVERDQPIEPVSLIMEIAVAIEAD